MVHQKPKVDLTPHLGENLNGSKEENNIGCANFT